MVEARPRLDVDESTAVRYLVREVLPADALLIYIGDDVSDEDPFAAIPDGITIRVGEAVGTRARYVLADVPAVAQFPGWLAQITRNGSIANTR